MPPRRGPKCIGDLGEFGFLADLLPRLPPASAKTGIDIAAGDDAAVVHVADARLVLTTDALVEGVHFQPSWLPSRQLGRRAYLVNASDIAAMGGVPRWGLVALAAPAETPHRHLRELTLGINDAAAEHGACIVGGNLSASPVLTISIAVVGTLAATPITRSGGKAGDLLFVSGELGGAAMAVRSLCSGRRLRKGSRLWQAYAEPPARVGLGSALAVAGLATAMIDVSDGLLQDLGHLCEQSGVGADVDLDSIPCVASRDTHRFEAALSGGEDYELLFAVRPTSARQAARIAQRHGCTLYPIGRLVARRGIRSLSGAPLDRQAVGGHDHFAARVHRRPADARRLAR